MAQRLDAIGIVVENIPRSLAFYRMLGVPVPEHVEVDHVECRLESGIRLMWDSLSLIKELDPNWQPPIGYRLGLAFHCDSVSELNALAADLQNAGYLLHKEPFDAFWGQRYAQVTDPDGNIIDLFTEL